MSPFFLGNIRSERYANNLTRHRDIDSGTLPTPSIEPEETRSRGSFLCRRIIDDIHKGVFQCMICYENIGRQSQIWHCIYCWGVYHYRCIQSWVFRLCQRDRQEVIIRFHINWTCPSCRNDFWGPPPMRCCKRHRANFKLFVRLLIFPQGAGLPMRNPAPRFSISIPVEICARDGGQHVCTGATKNATQDLAKAVPNVQSRTTMSVPACSRQPTRYLPSQPFPVLRDNPYR